MQTSIDRFQFLRGDLRGNRRGIRPPWSQPESQFIDLCERCGECLDACPKEIIENGPGGYPVVNFADGFCIFCGDCVKACNHKALRFPADPTIPPWMLEVAIDSSCLSLNGVVCRSCGDICEEAAIRFRLRTGGRSEPYLDPSACTGCGECVSACPNNAVTITPTHQDHAA